MADYWSIERWRMILLLAVALTGGYLSGHYLLAICIALVVYIALSLHQLVRLSRWVTNDAEHDRMPQLYGVWEQLGYRIFRLQRHNRQTRQRLISQINRFQTTATALPDATIVIDAQNNIQWANSISSALLGISLQDIGQRLDNLVRVPDFIDYLKINQFDQPLIMHAPHQNNTQLRVKVIELDNGQRLITAHDISQLMQVDAMRRDFVANVSHELRTPLTVISGYVETLLDDTSPDSPDDLRIPLTSIQNQTIRILNIIEDLLGLTQLEDNQAQIQHRVVNVPDILKTLSIDLQHVASARQQTISCDIDDQLLLEGNDKELRSVFINLISNALQHTPEGTTVCVRWFVDKNCPVFIVQDNGPGIPQEHLQRLTERFYRVDQGRSRHQGGTGLGLSIVKHVLMRHQAELDIQSNTIEGGTEFRCQFPAQARRVLSNAA